MKALTLHQPWAALWASGRKKNETRPQRWKYRGWLWVHAGLHFTEPQRLLCLGSPFRDALCVMGGKGGLDLGCVIGRVRIVDCLPAEEVRDGLTDTEWSFGDYSDGRWLLIGEDHELLPQDRRVVARGRQGLWNIPDEVEQFLEGVRA